MAKHKLTAKQRKDVRKNAKGKIAAGTPPSEVVKSIAEKYRITTVSARNYLPDGSAAKKGKPKPNRKVRKTKARRYSASRQSPPNAGGRLLQVVASLSESDLRKALVVKRLWSQRENLLQKKREVERGLRRIDGRIKTLQGRIERITGR